MSVQEQVEEHCQNFRKQIARGDAPQIERFLARFAEEHAENLFLRLLETEVNFRRSRNESPNSQEYIRRFPQYTSQVRRAFFEPSQLSSDGPGSRAPQLVETLVPDLQSGQKLGDYELVRQLGRGGMGVVHEAKHSGTGNRVALKTLPASVDGEQVDANRLYRFRREFRSLSEVNHPHLVGMQTLEVDGNQWFFTMDLIEGEDFLSYVRPGGELNETRLRRCLPQLVSAVVSLHQRGIIHRDLKPGNVLVSAAGQVSVLDFGLVAELQKATDMTQTRSGMFVGTPPYAAPEQMFGERTEASDWYAFGTMLYEALTASLPFQGGRQMEILRRKQQEDPPRLSGTTDVPEDLATLVDGLLPREPSERLTESQITDMLDLQSDTRVMGSSTAGSITSHGSSTTSGHDLDGSMPEYEEVVLIGREQQLAQLETARQQLVDSKAPLAVWVTGLSGEGKSALAETFLRPYRRSREMLVLSGRCYDRESVPFKAIDSLIEPLVRHLRSLSSAELKAVLPEDIAMLAHLFPLLNRVKVVERRTTNQIQSLDSRQIRYRAFAALRELLIGLSESTPVVLMIDDLQWGDADSAAALHAMFLGDNAPNVMFLGTYRRDEIDESGFHRQWVQAAAEREDSISEKHVSVEPLDQDQCVSLIVSRTEMPELDARDVVARLFDETKGNPYFLDQIIEGFQEGATDWQPVPLDQIIARKLSRLQDGARELLEIVAVAGKAADANEIVQISGGGPEVLALLTHMRSERLVRLVGSGDSQLVDTWHDKIRETVLVQLPRSRQQRIHRTYADHLISLVGLEKEDVYASLAELASVAGSGLNRISVSARLYDIAHHLHEASEPRSYAYLLLAGVVTLRNFAADEAMGFLQRVESCLPKQAKPFLRFLLWNSMGEACLIRKAAESAIENFAKAGDFAASDYQRCAVFTGLGAAERSRGRLNAAVGYYDRALELLGVHRPKSRLRCLLSLSVNTVRLLLSKGRRNESRTDTPRNPLLSARARVFHELALVEMEKNIFRCLQCYAQSCVVRFELGTPGAVKLGNSTMAFVWNALGVKLLGSRYHERAERLPLEADDLWLRGQQMQFIAASHYWSGRLQESKREFETSLDAISRSGEHYNASYVPHMLRHICHYISSSSEELANAQLVYQHASDLSNEQQLCWGAYDTAIAHARHGSLEDSVRWMHRSLQLLADERHFMTESIRGASLGFVCLQISEYERAGMLAEGAWKIARQTWMLHDVVTYSLPVLIESLIGPEWGDGASQRFPSQLRKLSRWAKILFPLQFNHRPHLLRTIARFDWIRGRRRVAVRRFERAVAASSQRGMKYQKARCLLDLAAVKQEGREENRAEAIRLLKEMESVIPRAESWLLGDQYDEAVVAPEFDLAAWEAQHGPLAHPEEEDL